MPTITTIEKNRGCTITGRVGMTVKTFILAEGSDEGTEVLERPEGVAVAVGYRNECDVREIPCGCEWKVLGYSTGRPVAFHGSEIPCP